MSTNSVVVDEPIVKRPLVLFSGGLDSTYALYCCLQYGPTDVVYVMGNQGPTKIKAEVKAQAEIIKELNRISPYQVEIQYSVDMRCDFRQRGAKFMQPIEWLHGALTIIDPDRHNNLLIGYCMGDEISSSLSDIATAWKALFEVTVEGDFVGVDFPLKFIKKVDMLHTLPASILKHIWVCERPRLDDLRNPKPCGGCPPCRRSKLTLIEYKMTYGRELGTKLLLDQLRDA